MFNNIFTGRLTFKGKLITVLSCIAMIGLVRPITIIAEAISDADWRTTEEKLAQPKQKTIKQVQLDEIQSNLTQEEIKEVLRDTKFEPVAGATDIASPIKETSIPWEIDDKQVNHFNTVRVNGNLLLDGKLKGKGKSIIAISKQWQVNPALIAAICAWETGRGHSAFAKQYNNVSGSLHKIGRKWLPRQFKTVEDCIEYTARNIRLNYLNQGRTTVKLIQEKYCPVIQDPQNPGFNDPKNLNQHWYNGVSNFRQAFMSNL